MKRVKNLGISLVVVSVVGIGLTGCGGGGGGGGSAGLAKPTLKNALEVKKQSTTNQKDLDRSSDKTKKPRGLNSVDKNSRINLSLLANDLSKKLLTQTKNVDLESYSLNQAINKKEDCRNNGSISINGFGDETNGGEVTLSYNQCNEDGEIINGNINVSLSGYDSELEDYKNQTIRFTSDFTINNIGNRTTTTIYSGSSMAIETTDLNKGTLRINMKATDGNIKYGCTYCNYHYTENDSTTEVYQTLGEVYINNLSAYVEYDISYDMSKTPFVFNNYNENLISGEARYIMADNAKMKIVVESRTEPVTYIDIDGNGNFDDDIDLNEKDDLVEPNEKGDEITPPKPTVSDKDISQKRYVEIVKNYKAGVCESDEMKNYLIKKEGLVNLTLMETTNNVSCSTYGKDEGRICTVEYADTGNVTCVIGYDDY